MDEARQREAEAILASLVHQLTTLRKRGPDPSFISDLEEIIDEIGRAIRTPVQMRPIPRYKE